MKIMSGAKKTGIILLLLGGLFILLGGGAEAAKCRGCHPMEGMGMASIHPPFMEDQCEMCHGQIDRSSSTKSINSKDIKWFLERHHLGGTAYIILPRRLRKYDLVFESQGPTFQERLSLESLPSLPQGHKPAILEAKLCGLEQGPWIEAKICVKTDLPTEVEINCNGVQGMSEGDFYTFQVISLAGLKVGKKYQCLLTARDISGEESQTKISFTTDHSFAGPQVPPARKVAVDLYQSPMEEPLLEIQSDGALNWRLGTIKKETSQAKRSHGHHKNLNSPVVAGLDACFKCHDSHSLGASHPVNVHLRQGMLAEGIPVFNGVVTCASCHNPHSAKEPYLLRKRGRNLCLSCHGQRYR